MQDAHITVRFFEIQDAVVRSIKCAFNEVPAALRQLEEDAQEAGYKLTGKTFIQSRWENLLQIGCVVDSASANTKVNITGSNNNNNNNMTFTTFDPRAKCAHLPSDPFSTSSSSSIPGLEEKHAHQKSLDGIRKEFVGMFKSHYDPELIANGDFFLVMTNNNNNKEKEEEKNKNKTTNKKIEMYAMLASDPPPVPVILDHDAGVDDLLALLLLASASIRPLKDQPRRIELIGTTIVDADCFATPSGELCRRLLSMFTLAPNSPPTENSSSPTSASSSSSSSSPTNHSKKRLNENRICNIPVGVSPLKGTAAPFPDDWRKDCLTMLDLPIMHMPAVEEAMEKRPDELDGHGHELLAQLVMESPRPVTLVVTGPLTNVAWALKKHGEAFAKNIREVSIMGGAVHVAGNVINANLPSSSVKVDGSAEWNIYWDAPAAKEVLASPLIKHKLLYSLDATNHVPVTPAFVRKFGKVVDPKTRLPTMLATFTGTSWAQTTFLGFLFGEERGYYAWDVICAMGILTPQIANYVPTKISVDAVGKSPSEGKTFVDEKEGVICRVPLEVDSKSFYASVLECTALF